MINKSLSQYPSKNDKKLTNIRTIEREKMGPMEKTLQSTDKIW